MVVSKPLPGGLDTASDYRRNHSLLDPVFLEELHLVVGDGLGIEFGVYQGREGSVVLHAVPYRAQGAQVGFMRRGEGARRRPSVSRAFVAVFPSNPGANDAQKQAKMADDVFGGFGAVGTHVNSSSRCWTASARSCSQSDMKKQQFLALHLSSRVNRCRLEAGGGNGRWYGRCNLMHQSIIIAGVVEGAVRVEYSST